MCDQQRLRSACTYAQSDQSLCLSLECSMSVKLLTEHHLVFLSLEGGYTGSSESTLVKIPHCWKSHVTALISIIISINSFNMHHCPILAHLGYMLTVICSDHWLSVMCRAPCVIWFQQLLQRTPLPKLLAGF